MEYSVFDDFIEKVKCQGTFQTKEMRRQGFKITSKGMKLNSHDIEGIEIYHHNNQIASIDHGYNGDGIIANGTVTEYEKYKHCKSLSELLNYCLETYMKYQNKIKEKELERKRKLSNFINN